jgi:biopolymer transport protein ExbB
MRRANQAREERFVRERAIPIQAALRAHAIQALLLAACLGWSMAALAQESPAAEPEAASEAAPVPTTGPEVEAAAQAADAASEPPEAASLAELLELVRAGSEQERAENQAREERFVRERESQAQMLLDAKAALARTEALSQSLEQAFQHNEVLLAEREATLADRLGSLGELFGVTRQVAGDTRGQLHGSLTSAQIRDDRDAFLGDVGKKRKLPPVSALERLWFELQREMTEQGRVVRFSAPVLTVDGGEVEREVIRAGVFSAILDGEYLLWEPSVQKLQQLRRQPPSEYVSTVAGFEQAESGLAPLAIDPSSGTLLSVLIDTRSMVERVPDGGIVGYVTIVLGVLAGLLAIVRIVALWRTGRRVVAQQASSTADPDNPLGRVLGVYEDNRGVDVETLELKLDEAVMREASQLGRFTGLVQVVSVVAPLLGLLGTVTGMIRTFQAITLFGAGDPRMMAGGISEALVTTMLGLVVAIPLVLLHAALSGNARRIIDVLQEQSAGLVARQAERAGA